MTIAAWETNYIALLDSIDGAVFLSQLIYWQKTMKGRWFYKTGESWQQEIGLSRYRRESLCKQLVERGILSTKREGVPPRTYYKINFEQLQRCLDALPESNNHEASKQTLPDVSPEMIDPAEALDGSVLTHSDTAQAHKKSANQNAAQQPFELSESLPLKCRSVANQTVSQPPFNWLESDKLNGHSVANQNAAQQPFELSESLPLKCRSVANQTVSQPPFNWLESDKLNGHSVANQNATQQRVDSSLASKLNGHPVTNRFATEQPYISEINTKINTKITHKTTTKTTHHNTFVELGKNSTADLGGQISTNEKSSATETPHCQTDKSGNSQQAARRGGGKPESLKKTIQPEGEGEANQGGMEHHLQSMKQALVPAEGSVEDIFAHWQTTLEHPAAKLDAKRRRLINTALKMGYTPNQLKQAITGCSKTPHNLGDNDRGQRYDGLHIILRDADQIDRFMANATSPPRKLNAQEQLEIDNKRIADDYLRSQGLTPVGEENIINHGEL